MVYTLLDKEKMTEVLKTKPRWMTCIGFALSILMIIMSAITIGVLIGYTYCYIEHHSGFRTGNLSQSTNLQIMQIPYQESEEAKGNRTINGALMSSVLISRILTVGQALMEEDWVNGPWSSEESQLIHQFT